jgi:hypothetical protein
MIFFISLKINLSVQPFKHRKEEEEKKIHTVKVQ